MRMPAPINWLRGVSCPYLVFDMGPTAWLNDRKMKEETIISIIRGEKHKCRLISVINEADREEVMGLIKNIPDFKGFNATWVEQNFFDIPYYALVGGVDEILMWFCLILPTTQLGLWSKELDHDWIDAYRNTVEEEYKKDDDEGFEGLGSLFG